MMQPMKYRTEWNLGLLYKSEKDPQIEKDVKAIEAAYVKFEKKYRGKNFVATAKTLVKALREYEMLIDKSTEKPWWYFALRTRLNSDDAVAGALSTKIEQRLESAANKIKFFSLDLGRMPKQKQKQFLKDEALAPYKYFLARIFLRAKYTLSEKEEQLASILSQTSYTMWVDMQDRLLNKQSVLFKGTPMPLSRALNTVRDLPKKDRRILHESINALLKESGKTAEGEINAIYNYKKMMDERRGYAQPYSATILGYENDEDTVLSLVETVTKSFSLSRKFYAIHAKLLGEQEITMADRGVQIGKVKRSFTFTAAVDLVKNSFAKVDPKYASFLSDYLEAGQIDVYPKTGKDSGAFCWGMGQLPTFILLNQVDDIRSVETLAHEMGHAIHTELSKKQPPLYRHYSTSCAEVASTFFEQLVTDELEKKLSEKEQLILLHNKVMGDITTIFRQIACFNFELELHQQIRKKGQLTNEQIALLMNKHLKTYTGKAVKVSENDGYFYVTWSHIRRFFYVYSYAYGQIISRSLYEKWKRDPTYARKIEQFLSAGRSKSPQDIFKSIGISTDAKFFEEGLRGIERDLIKLEKLAKKQGRI